MISMEQMGLRVGLFVLAIAMTTACTKTLETPPVNNPPENNNVIENPVDESPEPRVYWLREEGDRLVLAHETVNLVQDTPENQLNKLFEQLLAGTTAEGQSTVIPEGTKLLNLAVQPDGIVVNLSEDFTFGGGSASMIGRVAQVLYTATSLDPQAAVWFQIEGEPLELLGGEGLEIAQPMTRTIFEENFEL